MTKKIVLRYPLLVDRATYVKVPADSQVLSVGAVVHNGVEIPSLWVLFDAGKPLVARKFRVFVTGEWFIDDPRPLKFVGTFIMHNNTLVFHVFEEIEKVE